MALIKTTSASKNGRLVVHCNADVVVVDEADGPSSTVSVSVPLDFVAVNPSGRYIAGCSFKAGARHNNIVLLHRPMQGVVKELSNVAVAIQPDDRLVWMAWHPASFGDNHLVCLSLLGQLLVYSVSVYGSCVERRVDVRSPSDHSLKCRCGSFVANPVSLFHPFTLFVLLESAEIVAVSPVIPKECQSVPPSHYAQHSAQLQQRLQDIVANASEFADCEYEDAAGEAELVRAMIDADDGRRVCLEDLCSSSPKVQGPFAVHPEPREAMLSSAEDLFVCAVSASITVLTIVCSQGRIDINCLLDDIHPRWKRGDSAGNVSNISNPGSTGGGAAASSIVYLVDSIKLPSGIVHGCVVEGLETELLVVDSHSHALHLSLLPLASTLATDLDVLGVEVQQVPFKKPSRCIHAWHNDADLDGGSLVVANEHQQLTLKIPLAKVPALRVDRRARVDALAPPDLSALTDALCMFSSAVRSLPSRGNRVFADGSLTVADLQIANQALTGLTDKVNQHLLAEIDRLFSRAALLESINNQHRQALAAIGNMPGERKREDVQAVQDKQARLRERAAALFSRSPRAPKDLEELVLKFQELSHRSDSGSLQGVLQRQSRLIESIKSRIDAAPSDSHS